MPSIDLPGARLHYRTVGSGKPLVLVHGSATDMTTWDGVIDNLASDHRVTVYDRRGYGQSEHRPVRDHRIHARDLCAVLEQAVGEPAKVLGWSSGGNIALASATARPDLFSELVVVEAPFHGLRHADRAVLATAVRLKLLQLRGHPREAAEVFFRFATALQSGGNSYDLADDSVRNDILRNATPILAEWDPHPFGVMAEHISVRAVVNLPMPITWVLGSESSPWMTGLHTRVQRRRPDIDTIVINGAGHLIHLDCPAEFVAAVRGEPTRTDHIAPTSNGS